MRNVFQVLPNFHDCFYNSIEHEEHVCYFFLENTVTKARVKLVFTLIIKT